MFNENILGPNHTACKVQPQTGEEREGTKPTGGLYYNLGVIEPNDDPLSCLVDEEGEGAERGMGWCRPPMRLLVAPVDPRVAVSPRTPYRLEILLACTTVSHE